MITVKNLTKSYPASRNLPTSTRISEATDHSTSAVSNLSFNVETGESLAIVGTGQSGKSTLLKLLAGLTSPTEGTINVHGHIPEKLERSFKREIGYAPYNPDTLLPDLPVQDNFDLLSRIYHLDPHKYQQTIDVLTERLKLTSTLKTIGHNLDLVQRRKYALACAFLHHPNIILLDEPFMNLGCAFVEEIQ
jgi:ABC-2 type transport system ATP-binding protein